ncbi:MAG: hypothetical protein ABIH21_05630 [Patescibacteria group bacterium]
MQEKHQSISGQGLCPVHGWQRTSKDEVALDFLKVQKAFQASNSSAVPLFSCALKCYKVNILPHFYLFVNHMYWEKQKSAVLQGLCKFSGLRMPVVDLIPERGGKPVQAHHWQENVSIRGFSCQDSETGIRVPVSE